MVLKLELKQQNIGKKFRFIHKHSNKGVNTFKKWGIGGL